MKSNTKKTLQYYWQACQEYRLFVFIAIAGTVLGSAVSAIVPVYYKYFFDTLTGNGSVDTTVAALFVILSVIAVLEILQWFLWRGATFAASFFQSRVMTDLMNQSFEYLHQHSFTFFNNTFVGSLVKKVKWFSQAFERISDRFLWNILPLVVNVIVIAAVLMSRNIWLGLAILLWTVIFLAVNWLFSRFKLQYDIARSIAETKTTSFLADTITNHTTVKLFNGYDREKKSFGRVNMEFSNLRRWTWDLGNIFEAIQGILVIALELGVFFGGVVLWKRGYITVGDFVLIQAYLFNIFHRVWDFSRIIRDIYESLADASEMTEILNEPHEIRDVPGAQPLTVTAGIVEFRDVDFNYYQTRKVLDSFNLSIKARERLALIGPSGAGKTTIVRLLLRLHEVDSGEILIDDQNITHVTQESLWQAISLVPQDPILFHRSLLENIRYGKPDATVDDVIAAAKAAHCHEFISQFPDGYETHVGERGVKLSGGERQRVAIARAILRGSPILILDEATSSLDSESEGLIQDALKNLMKGKTVIVIAHRLSTIRQMDRIVVVDQGIVIEEGTHAKLSKKRKGIYRRLWELQAGGFIA